MPVIIQLDEPSLRDAVIASPAKNFAQAYILNLVVDAQSSSEDDLITINYCPFDQESGEKLIENTESLTVPFWQTMAAVPEAALAFAAVANALPVMIENKKQALAEQLAAEQEAAEQLVDPPTEDTAP
jgi:hypothetical protein